MVMYVIACDAEPEQQTDAEDTSVNESLSSETVPADESQSSTQVEEVKSPVVAAPEPPAPNIASPVQQVLSHVIKCAFIFVPPPPITISRCQKLCAFISIHSLGVNQDAYYAHRAFFLSFFAII